jgi:16S rRNA (cytosine1402-N4)-methyltransferase
MNNHTHLPVLANEVLQYIRPSEGDDYLDVTAGYGGHAGLILEKIGKSGSMTLVDRDLSAVEHLAKCFAQDKRVKIYHNDYLTASQGLAQDGPQFDCILADIGVSSPHLDNPDRGFSFMNDGPLDMRMDTTQELTADTVVNQCSEKRLVGILREYGEVRGATRLARAIIDHRPLHTTKALATIIQNNTSPPARMRVCAQVFQALRIVVNDELGQLERSLPLWLQLLRPKGRLGVITFHSLEDRIVKQFFAEHAGNRFDAELLLLTKGVVTGENTEIVLNPRARSAKLRVAQRK